MNYYQQETECAAPEKIREIQSERLVNTVQRVYENVAYYRKLMDEKGVAPGDIKSVDDLSKLPFLTKDDLRENYPSGLLAMPLSDVVRIQSTSGTTGKRVVAFYTQRDIDLWEECCARALVAAGGTRDDVVQVCYGYGLFTGGLGAHYGAEKIGASVIPISGGNTRRQLQLMHDFGSTALACTPSYALYLAEALRESDYKREEFKLRVGILGAEPWTENMRREIEEKFQIKAIDIFGLSEIVGPGVSCECTCQNGLHVNEDHFVPEIIHTETLEVLPEGEEGELVFTTDRKSIV